MPTPKRPAAHTPSKAETLLMETIDTMTSNDDLATYRQDMAQIEREEADGTVVWDDEHATWVPRVTITDTGHLAQVARRLGPRDEIGTGVRFDLLIGTLRGSVGDYNNARARANLDPAMLDRLAREVAFLYELLGTQCKRRYGPPALVGAYTAARQGWLCTARRWRAIAASDQFVSSLRIDDVPSDPKKW